jgi:hypothetical protein
MKHIVPFVLFLASTQCTPKESPLVVQLRKDIAGFQHLKTPSTQSWFGEEHATKLVLQGQAEDPEVFKLSPEDLKTLRKGEYIFLPEDAAAIIDEVRHKDPENFNKSLLSYYESCLEVATLNPAQCLLAIRIGKLILKDLENDANNIVETTAVNGGVSR